MYNLIIATKRELLVLMLLALFITPATFGQTAVPADSLAKVLTSKEAEMFNIILTGDKAAADRMIG